MRALAPVLSIGIATFVFAGTALAAPPANDDFANRQVITGASGSASGTTVDSTVEANESSFFTSWGGSDPYEGGVWYAWTAPASGAVAFRTTNLPSGSDTILAAETGTGITDLQTVVQNDDYAGLSSRILFNAVDGTTYYIGVGPYWYDDPSYYGTFTLEWGSTGVDYFDSDLPSLGASATGGKNALTVNFSASDQTANFLGGSWLTLECSVDGGAYSPCTSPWVSTIGGGLHTWSVRATDGADNATTSGGTTRVKGRKNLP